MTDSDRKTKLRQIIEADHAASLAIFQRVPADKWNTPVPSDEGAQWNAHDVLAHAAGSEAGQHGQIQRALTGGVTVPDDFDLNRFNRRAVQKQAEVPVAELLATIEREHQAVLDTLAGLTDAQLDITGRHARGDTLTMEQFFHRITEHRREHAEALAKALGI